MRHDCIHVTSSCHHGYASCRLLLLLMMMMMMMTTTSVTPRRNVKSNSSGNSLITPFWSLSSARRNRGAWLVGHGGQTTGLDYACSKWTSRFSELRKVEISCQQVSSVTIFASCINCRIGLCRDIGQDAISYTPRVFNAPDEENARRIFATRCGTRKTKVSNVNVNVNVNRTMRAGQTSGDEVSK